MSTKLHGFVTVVTQRVAKEALGRLVHQFDAEILSLLFSPQNRPQWTPTLEVRATLGLPHKSPSHSFGVRRRCLVSVHVLDRRCRRPFRGIEHIVELGTKSLIHDRDHDWDWELLVLKMSLQSLVLQNVRLQKCVLFWDRCRTWELKPRDLVFNL